MIGPLARPGWRWRTGYVAAAVIAWSWLLTGLVADPGSITFSGTGPAATGTVAMAVNARASHVCRYGSLLPGDLTGSATCALSVTYTGSIPAYLSLTVRIAAAAGAGGSPLYDGTNSAGLIVRVSDGHFPYTVPTGAGTTGGSCPAGFTCWTAANDLAAWYPAGTPNLTFGSGDTVTFTVIPVFPRTAGDAYQGGEATVTLVVQAVQVPANRLPGTCTTATIGQPCPAAGPFTWS